MLQSVQKAVLFARLVIYSIKSSLTQARRLLSAKLVALTAPASDAPRSRNIVVVGAAFAGYHSARLIAEALPRGSPFKVVVVEPNTHYNFTWVLPRFCVVPGHENKAFIPYGGYLSAVAEGSVQWIRDRVVSVGRTSLSLRDSPDELPFDFLVLATGATVPEGLPSRVGAETKTEGMALLKAVQDRIQAAATIVVGGGGAAGVELATDAKSLYPEKTVVLVHSRKAVMNRFGPSLQTAALEGLEQLGVEVVLGEKVVSKQPEQRSVTLSSGRKIECDYFVRTISTTLTFEYPD